VARFSIYVTEKELAWLKLQKPGWLRKTIKLYKKSNPGLIPERKDS
jgi:hypothetical protein